MPIISVMEQLNEHRNDPAKLDAKSLVTTLSDSLAFLASANVAMVQHRHSCLKFELPRNLHLLSSEMVEFSGTNLLGNSLSSDIKEVTELNRISQQVPGPSKQ